MKNREIKFRAWNRLERSMVDCESWTMRHIRTNNDDDFSLMQYTGLTDKNGVEIYEGDVVSDGLDEKMQVYWDEDYARFGLIDEGMDYVFEHGDTDKIKVIGNIFENPELCT